MSHGGRSRDIDGLNLRRHFAVHTGHLHFVVKVGAVAQSANDHGRAVHLRRIIRGEFPRIFARESAHNTPGFGLCFGSALATLLILANYQKSMVSVFTFMILLSTTACLVLYALCSLALLRLQWTNQLGAARRGTVPLAIAGVLATAYSLWAIVGAGAEAVLWGAALLLLGVPLYYWFRSSRS